MYKFIIAILFIYVSIVLILYLVQKRFIFFPTPLAADYAFPHFSDFEEHYFEPAKGVRLHALHFKVAKPKGVVLYFHGNAGALDSWGHAADDLRRLGYDVFMPDYRGYGKSSGPLSEYAMNQDALLMFNFLLEKYPADHIILYGRSLGSGVACKLATKVKCRLLILETPYTSILDMSKLTVPYVPVQWLLRFRFRNDKNIRKLKCPVHIFHGTNDELIPYYQAVRLAEIYGDIDILTTVVGAGHNNLEEFESFQKGLKELLD